MRGFAALLVAAAFAITAFHALALQKSSWEAQNAELEGALKVTSLRAVEDDLQSSLQMVLLKAGAGEKKPRERVEKIFLKLAEWERFAEGKYGREGVEVDLWLGIPSEEEKTGLPVKILGEKRVLKCAACVDLSSLEAVLQLQSGRNHVIQRTKTSPLLALPSGEFGAGWSVYLKREGLASIGSASLPAEMVNFVVDAK